MFRRPTSWRGLALALCLGGARGLAAQAVTGVGDDAIPLPKGAWRILVSGLWNDYTGVYAPVAGATGTGLKRQPLYHEFGTSAAGVAQFPTLAAAEGAIRTLTGDAKYAISLGPLSASGAVRQSIAPLSLDYGFTRRLSVRLLVPYAESRDITQLRLNSGGVATSIGINPAFGTTGAAARATNGDLLSQIDAARTALSAEITRCATATETGCDAIRANPTGAQGLLTRSLETRVALAALYGTATRGGAPVVPTSSSAVQTQVVSTIAAMRTDFVALGISNLSASAAPAGATVVLGPGGGLTRIASDTSFGVGYARLGNTRRAGIGDIDLTATYLLFDTFGGSPARRVSENRHALRSTLTGGWRFGVAGADRAEDAFDVPIGEGANALLVRSTTDLVWSRALWLSASVRAAKPLSDVVAMAVPLRELAGVFAPVSIGSASRALGLRYDLEIAPRIALGDFFGLSGAMLYRHWGSDSYSVSGSETNSVAVQRLETPARSLTAASFGASFSTMASYQRGRARFPAEVIYTHTEPLGASGGVVPAIATERLELRIYTGFPRR
jgi:hypothetical protein